MARSVPAFPPAAHPNYVIVGGQQFRAGMNGFNFQIHCFQFKRAYRERRGLRSGAERIKRVIDEFVKMDIIQENTACRNEVLIMSLLDFERFEQKDKHLNAQLIEMIDTYNGFVEEYNALLTQQGEVDIAMLMQILNDKSSDEISNIVHGLYENAFDAKEKGNLDQYDSHSKVAGLVMYFGKRE